jgi:N-acetylmuramoyl-L-alanine amidase
LKREKIPVFLTRETDKHVPIKDKVEFAKQKRASFFIAIHANFSNESEKISGIETHFAGKSLFSKSKKFPIIFSPDKYNLFQKADDLVKKKMVNSQSLAKRVQEEIVSSLKQQGLSVVDRGIKSTGFRTLIQSPIPACIIETGFMTNRRDLESLKEHFYRKLLAKGICSGIKNHINAGKASTS